MSEVLYKEDSLVNLSQINLSENFLFELTNIIEKNAFQGQKISINSGSLDISKNQLESMLSVLSGFGIEVKIIYAGSKETQIAAIESGITVSGQLPEINITEPTTEEQNHTENPEDELENILWHEIDSEEEKKETLYIQQTLRSGQKIEFDGNILLIGDCNAGSEIIATGDIIVWGILNGIAYAGSDGNEKARIRAFKINAIQLRIADYLARKPDRIEVQRSEKSEFFTPEEARISEDEIVIYSLQYEN